MLKTKLNEKIALKVSFVTIVINTILSAFKLAVGILANSGAMISDAVHSISDVLGTFIVIIGVKISNKDSDKKHPYGYERMECVVAVILSVILCSTGAFIGYMGAIKIFYNNYGGLSVPGASALFAAVISIIVKESMYWYTKSAAKKIDSGALMADAWHHRSDSLSSVGSFLGILGARLGFPILDPIASIIICVFVIKASVDIFKDSISKMTDTACDDSFIEEIIAEINKQEGVLGIDQIKTRLFGNRIYIDIEIRADGDETLSNAHNIAQKIHDNIEINYPKVKHCMIHINPVTIEI